MGTEDGEKIEMKTTKNTAIIVGCVIVTLSLLVGVVRSSAAESTLDRTPKQIKQFEYRTCMVQYDRVTFVNAVWNGKVQPAPAKSDVAIKSCPLVHEYLQTAGTEGWELVTCFSQRVEDENTLTLFLKKER